ncbi:MAG: hypothetical protein CMA12_06600 [Euryarchaeota archaeon]|nr:hypothetical protein [Euryarchaeota archaeon]OUW22112.1 MAG: hypothetical protein CBD33_03560 [Euryarchaeota archaeon TMED173]
MTVNTPPKDGVVDLRKRLAGIPRNRLVEEVVSRWDDVIRLEGEIANLRRRLREAELVTDGGVLESSRISQMEERLRIADSKVRKLEGSLINEKSRRKSVEEESSRLVELQAENSRLLKNEEELLLLVLDMESEIDRLTK